MLFLPFPLSAALRLSTRFYWLVYCVEPRVRSLKGQRALAVCSVSMKSRFAISGASAHRSSMSRIPDSIPRLLHALFQRVWPPAWRRVGFCARLACACVCVSSIHTLWGQALLAQVSYFPQNMTHWPLDPFVELRVKFSYLFLCIIFNIRCESRA